MTVATRKPPKLKRISLREYVDGSRAGRVDREKGIIYRVKILGLESANGRRYTQSAVRNAISLYEGKKVYCDHPDKPSDQRGIRDVFGWFENVIADATGLYGDFHLVNPSTELAESVMNAAESKPDLYGFSHNALGEGDTVDGTFVVGRISEVRSVDLVSEPATTKSLFEGRTMKKITLRKLLEWVKPSKPAAQKQLKALMEMPEDDAPMDMELDAPMDMPAEAPAEGGMDALTNAIGAIIKDGNHELAMKILKLIQADAEPEAPVTEEEDEDKDKDDKEKPVKEGEEEDEKDKEKMESIKRELATLKADKNVRVLVEDAGLKFGKPDHREAFIESLLPLSDAKRKALIEERKALAGVDSKSKTRSSGLERPITESIDKFPTTREEAKRLLVG